MKQIIVILFSFMFIHNQIVAQNGYSITCNIIGIPENSTIYLIHAREGGWPDTVARTTSKNGRFSFKGKLEFSGEFYFVKIDTQLIKIKPGQQTYFTILLDNSKVKVNGDFRNWPNVQIVGSKSHLDYVHYQEYLKYPKNEMDSLQKVMKNMISVAKGKGVDSASAQANLYALFESDEYNSVLVRYGELYPIANEKLNEYIQFFSNSYFTPYLVNSRVRDTLELENYLNALDLKIRNGFYATVLRRSLDQNKRFAIGRIVPTFIAQDSNRMNISLEELQQDNKLILIDFWASWCKPCRDEFPKLKKLYKQYKEMGFEIVGVSTDKVADYNKWIDAMVKEELPWKNVIDDEKKRISNDYNIEWLPTTFLIDKSGKIVAKGLAIEEVEKILSKLLSKEK